MLFLDLPVVHYFAAYFRLSVFSCVVWCHLVCRSPLVVVRASFFSIVVFVVLSAMCHIFLLTRAISQTHSFG